MKSVFLKMVDSISAGTNKLVIALGKLLETVIPGFTLSSQNPAVYSFNGQAYRLGIFRTGDDIEFDFGIAKVNLTDLFGKSPQFGFNLPFSDFSFLLNAAAGKSPIPSGNFPILPDGQIVPPIRSPIELVVSKWIYNVV